VFVLTTHPHYPEWRVRVGYGGWSRRDDLGNVQLRRVAHYVPANPTGLRRLVSEVSLGLRYLVARWRRPDVVVLVSPNLFSTALAALRARWSRRLATGIWVQDLYSLGVVETEQGGRSVAALIRTVESRTLRSANGVAVIHDRFRQFAVAGLGVPESRLEVIRNWSHVRSAPNVDRASVRQRMGWGPDETVLLHAGNMGLKQGLENVVEAARLADESLAPVRFVLLGDGNQRQRLQALAHGISRIEFVPPLPQGEFEDVLASADILLLNERRAMREMSVPSKLTTYFSTMLPVLAATDEASLTAAELDASGGGLRVAAGEPGALLAQALALRGDSALARTLGAAGHRYRQQVLGEGAALDRFEHWLTLLIDRSRQSVRRPIHRAADDVAAAGQGTG
jgi:glycosyltransferase involved in cell wall biosynthesis